MKPRYTDQHRWPNGYDTAAQSLEAGYLKAKFDRIRKAPQQPVTAKVSPIKTQRSAR